VLTAYRIRIVPQVRPAPVADAVEPVLDAAHAHAQAAVRASIADRVAFAEAHLTVQMKELLGRPGPVPVFGSDTRSQSQTRMPAVARHSTPCAQQSIKRLPNQIMISIYLEEI
jgi:hypothetical protein